MDPDEVASRERIRKAIEDHVVAYHSPAEGDVVTDFVVVAGWVNFSTDRDGVHITSSPSTPGYTVRGLLETACSIYHTEPSEGDE